MKKWKRLAISLALPHLAGLVGSFFTAPAITSWYAVLQKPGFTPPGWLFGPVWLVLYTLMGIALFLVWEYGWQQKKVRAAISIFGAQIFLNALWSILFFGLRSPGWALIEIAFLWLAILWTIVLFYNISKLAAYLLVPYILWVSFALYLNYAIWSLNYLA